MEEGCQNEVVIQRTNNISQKEIFVYIIPLYPHQLEAFVQCDAIRWEQILRKRRLGQLKHGI